MPEYPNHDPNSIYDTPEQEDTGLTVEQIQDRVNFARSLNSIKSLNSDGKTLNVEATKAQRERFIEEKGLAETETYNKNIEIALDENGIPFSRPKEIRSSKADSETE